MSFPKLFAGSLLALSLFVPCTQTRANFSSLTEHTRSYIIGEAAFFAVTATIGVGSLALIGDITNQPKQPNDSYLQRLSNVQWKDVIAASLVTGAGVAVIRVLFNYYTAPEWTYNSLESKMYSIINRIKTSKSFDHNGLRSHDPEVWRYFWALVSLKGCGNQEVADKATNLLNTLHKYIFTNNAVERFIYDIVQNTRR